MQQIRLLSALSLGALVLACGSSGHHSSSASGDDSSSNGGSSGGATGTSGGTGVPNCDGIPATCGATGDQNCCAGITVQGGTFQRGFDGVNNTDGNYPATVSTFALDRYLVTVGRFRSFVTAVENGWQPAGGAGKHAYLSGGGLNGGSEGGWDTSWNDKLATDRGTWDQNLLCDPTLATWTSDAGSNEQHPVNCVLWEEAYAFCIWDGGFLPSEAESNYAAAGGSDQRVFAWSAPASMTSIDCSYANFNPGSPCTGALNDVGSESPKGDGKWGHADLAGNVWEWTLDYYASPFAIQQCSDCADLASGGIRVIRGGTFYDGPDYMAASYRHNYSQTGHSPLFGVRCGRAPTQQ